ncbi:glyoxysomal fatty acid beta-oxidation multifunctional protein MFP-a-like isoform X1 [Dioscorea cayenensis subsp. rotundata]|uniref:Glyoxysomal fatty acid beta-oxidation multifunctional protein MFP-a-like isoform X1 n=1 Tax=Dioscorea cayennensis subsp. rotundata TaxID=55577 RepID=A0AB40BJ26_DIOCR|nr:glyoxysomal fatty acid beta-oxidation multifunctional protein MFP-a-like isoform X1 [Dioscorea cayenensis subsp. rotundata]
MLSGGFDIGGLRGIQEGKIVQPETGYLAVDLITGILEDSIKPMVSAINGLAIGGGLEISMACHARISTSTADIGLPELTVGVIPGFGGTQRLPRLIGLSKALEMILTSKIIKGNEAHRLGLVDAIALPDELLDTACRWALDIAESRRPWIKTLNQSDKLGPLDEARNIFDSARAQARKQSAYNQLPLDCIDVIEEGIVSGPLAGLWKEAHTFQKLIFSDESKNLVHVFFARQEILPIPGINCSGSVPPREINKIAVVGGGRMGSGIVTALILSNFHVILKEIDDNFLQEGLDRVQVNLRNRLVEGKLNPEEFDKTFSLLTGVLDYQSFKDVDMVIEAVSEDVSLKQQIFVELEKYCPSNCVLATTTSAIDLNLIGEKINCSDRIIGAHFFSPAQIMPLLEIVHTPKTSPEIIADLMNVAAKIQKIPVTVRNCTGFAVSRMLFPCTQSALFLVDHGLDIYRIDNAITKFGMQMGPFRLMDSIGFGDAIAIGDQFLQSFPKRCFKSMLIPLMFEDKRTGEATGKGFYSYDDNGEANPDHEIQNYIEKSRNISGTQLDPEIVNLSEIEILEMLLFPAINEACRILEEGIAAKASHLDIASIMAQGFPSFRGGAMFWADSLGTGYIHTKLENWAKKYGNFFEPSSFLAERAAKSLALVSINNLFICNKNILLTKCFN